MHALFVLKWVFLHPLLQLGACLPLTPCPHAHQPGGAGPRPASLPQIWFHAGLVEVENVHVKVVRNKE